MVPRENLDSDMDSPTGLEVVRQASALCEYVNSHWFHIARMCQPLFVDCLGNLANDEPCDEDRNKAP